MMEKLFEDMENIEEQIVLWIQQKVKEAGAKGVVIGISGGIDSAVVSVLCKKAFPNNTIGLVLPINSSAWDMVDAKNHASKFKIDFKVVNLERTFSSFLKDLAVNEIKETDLAIANIKPRLRMAALYYFANKLNYLVVGTDNKSELNTGYFTKYGDGGVDILPIADLYKTELKQLAFYLGIDDNIINKAPTAGLWENQTDEKEMGLTYKQLDAALSVIEGSVNMVPHNDLERASDLFQKSRHKRATPPICKLK